MSIETIKELKELRERTGAGFGDCKKALSQTSGNIDEALEWLKKQGLAQMAKRAGKEASEGLIASYIHTNSRIGILLEVNTETDFSARSEAFQTFVKNLTLHITAMNPICISEKDIPTNAFEKQKQMLKEQVLEEGKTAQVAEKIIEGRLEKWKKEICLLNQPFFHPGGDEKEITVEEAIAELTNQIREKIVIRRFVCYKLGEGDSASN